MSIAVNCSSCGTPYELKDEFAGKLVKCPKCGTSNRVEGAKIEKTAQAEPEFDRDVFLFSQKVFTINQKYSITGDKGEPLLFVERPAHFFRNLLAVFGAAIAGIVFVSLGIGVSAALQDAGMPTASAIMGLVALFGFVVVAVLVGGALSKKRHTTFYRGGEGGVKLLDVLQKKKIEFITTTFIIRDANEKPLGQLQKNQFTNIIRRKWRLMDLSGRDILVAKEDSIILSLLRRLLGPLFGLLRTNYVFEDGAGRHVGEFQRKLTILDRYALDMRADPRRTVDRRLAVALGVILDTGERR